MAEQFAGLTLGVNVEQLNRAVKSLQDFKQANDSTKGSVQDFVNTEEVARQKAKQLAQELEKQNKAFREIQNSIDPTAAKMRKLTDASKQLDQLWKKGIVPDEDFFQLGSMLETQIGALERNKKALTEEGRAALEASKAKEKLKNAGRDFIADLQTQAAMIGKTKEELLEMKAAQLGVSAQAAPLIQQLKAQTQQFGLAGISAGQYQQAIKLLPMQITDVVTSLASGMPVWMVAIQQGGQIKDSFGGIANTLKYLRSLITPFTVGLTGMVGALGYLVYRSYESKRALEEIKTTVQDATGLSGKFAERLAMGVQELGKVSEESAETLKKAYISSNDSADQAVMKLVEVGMSYTQAKQTVEKYKDSMDFTQANNDILEHVGAVYNLAKGWFEASEEKKKYQISPTGGGGGSLAQKELGHINKALLFAKQTNEDIANVVKISNREFAKRAQEIDKQNLSLNRVRAAQEALNKALEDQKYVAASGDKELQRKAAENVALRKQELADLQKKNEKEEKGKKITIAAGVKLGEQYERDIIALEAQLKVLKEHRSINDAISSQRKSLWAEEAKIQVIREASTKRVLTDEEKSILANAEKTLNLAKQKAILGDQIVEQTRLNKLQDDASKFILQQEAAIKSLRETRAMSDREAQRYKEREKVKADFLAAGGAEDSPELQRMLERMAAFYAEEDEMRMNWLDGMNSSFKTWGDNVMNMSENMSNLAVSALDGISQSFTDFLTTGKANFADFAKSIIEMIVQMITKMVIFNSLSGMMGGSTWTLGSLIGGAGFARGGYTGDGGKYDPAGIVHKGEFVFTKEATKRIGTDNLYRLMRGYANGGQVGSAVSGGARIGGGSQFSFGDINVDVNNGNDPKGMESGVRMIVNEMMSDACRQGGKIYDFVMSRT